MKSISASRSAYDVVMSVRLNYNVRQRREPLLCAIGLLYPLRRRPNANNKHALV